MSRGLALFLIAIGLLLCGLGLVVLIQANKPAAGRGNDLLLAGLILEGAGVVLLILGGVCYRRAGPLMRRSSESSADTPAFLYVPNKPIAQELDGATYTVLYTPPVKGKHARPPVLRVSTPADAPGEFHMAPETWFDRACKRFGLAVEVETGDAAFDEECYVRSDTPEFAAAYLADPLKRVAIRDLRRIGFSEVILKNHDLAATWTGFTPRSHDQPDLCVDAAARLLILARNLPEHRPEFENRVGARRRQWQFFLWALLALFALTLLSLLACPVLSGSELLVRALIILVPGLPMFGYLAAALLRGTSTSHHAWAALMIGAVLLFPVGSVGTIALLNGLLDQSAATPHDALVVERYTTKSKNSVNYHVRVASWRDAGQTESFQVSSAEFNMVVPHQSHFVVTTHPGLLGVEWVESKRLKNGGR
jgi:hypothetical protein